MRILLLVLLLSLAIGSAAREARSDSSGSVLVEPDAVFLWGPDYSFSIAADPGWIIDENIPHANCRRAGIYPRGVDPRDPNALVTYMFVKTISRKDHPGESLSQYVEREWNTYAGAVPSASKTVATLLTTRSGQTVVVMRVQPGTGQISAIQAYVEEEGAFILFVLSGRTEKNIDDGLSAFRHVVESYFPMSIPTVDGQHEPHNR